MLLNRSKRGIAFNKQWSIGVGSTTASQRLTSRLARDGQKLPSLVFQAMQSSLRVLQTKGKIFTTPLPRLLSHANTNLADLTSGNRAIQFVALLNSVIDLEMHSRYEHPSSSEPFSAAAGGRTRLTIIFSSKSC